MADDKEIKREAKNDCQNNELRVLLQEFNGDPYDFGTQLDINEWFNDIADCLMN